MWDGNFKEADPLREMNDFLMTSTWHQFCQSHTLGLGCFGDVADF